LKRRFCPEATDPNLLYEIQNRLHDFELFVDADVNAFAQIYFDPRATQDRIYAVLQPVRERFEELSTEERSDFRSQLSDYVRSLRVSLANIDIC
jgi:type I restriction enzyme R subunit